MVIPPATEIDPWASVEPDRAWNTLSPEAKHERILSAAGRLFSTEGLDAPMPAVAAMAGAGVGSLYWQFPSKRDLLAALVVRRLEQIHDAAIEAAARPGSHWEALCDMLLTIVERQHGDDFLGEAWAHVGDHEDVAAAADRALKALDQLLSAAQAEGRARPDATTFDIRLIFNATRAAKQVEPEAWRRMLALLLDGLAARR
jgi:AcrR family transcriptional regulator